VTSARRVEAVTVDLDDTLYEQRHFLVGAWAAVADAGAARGLARGPLHRALLDVASEGSDRGRIVDRALERIGAEPAHAAPLVDAFRRFEPDLLAVYPGARAALAALRARVPVACITDGDPGIQRAKLRALALDDAFDALVISDEIGRDVRKPHPLPFLRAVQALGVAVERTVHVGDRPAKDVAGAAAAGLLAVRVTTGEYGDDPIPPGCPAPLATVASVREAFELIATLATTAVDASSHAAARR
jgi:putative hydrolase of the HAD superfamily